MEIPSFLKRPNDSSSVSPSARSFSYRVKPMAISASDLDFLRQVQISYDVKLRSEISRLQKDFDSKLEESGKKVDSQNKQLGEKIEIATGKLNEKIRNASSKGIETLGIFVALFTFISLSFGLLKESGNYYLAVALLLVAGGILIGIILLLDLILSPLKINLKNSSFFILACLLIYFGNLRLEQSLPDKVVKNVCDIYGKSVLNSN